MENRPILIDKTELEAEAGGVVLIDVRLESDYLESHLPGARNNCVFEVGFLDRMSGLAPDRGAPVCVYGAGPDSHESRMAAGKLLRGGYGVVYDYRGGIAEWTAGGGRLEGEGSDARGRGMTPRPDGEVALDLGESRLEWLGRNLLNKHWGTIDIASGVLRFADGSLIGGEFSFDLSTMRCTDLSGDDLHDVLIGHLLSDDFLDAGRHPVATYRILSVSETSGLPAGEPNLRVEGELELKDRRGSLSFDAVAGWTPDGRPAAQAAFAFDRTLWNILYGSAKYFSNLGGHLVNDRVEIQLRIVGEPVAV